MVIDPSKKYTLKEVISGKLIPKMRTYSNLYKLITVDKPDKDNKTKQTRILATETTVNTLKATSDTSAWSKINGKIYVQGLEILKFLKIHKLIS